MKIMDKLKKEFKCNKKGILFLLGIALIGFIFETIFITIISNSDKTMVKDYVGSFIDNIRNNKINYTDNFVNILISNFSFIIVVWLLGMSVIGVPINVFYYFINFFILGFSVVSFILTYKIIFTLIVYYSINFSLTLIFAITKKKSINFKQIINKYLKVLIFSSIILLLTSLYEGYIIPNIMNKLMFIIK